MDQTPVDYVHWANGEPTDVYGGKYENCVEMYANEYGTWNDEDCAEGGTYVCKMPKGEQNISELGSITTKSRSRIIYVCMVYRTRLSYLESMAYGKSRASLAFRVHSIDNFGRLGYATARRTFYVRENPITRASRQHGQGDFARSIMSEQTLKIISRVIPSKKNMLNRSIDVHSKYENLCQ